MFIEQFSLIFQTFSWELRIVNPHAQGAVCKKHSILPLLVNISQIFAETILMTARLLIFLLSIPGVAAAPFVKRCDVRETLEAITGPNHADRMQEVEYWLKESRKYHQEKLGDPTVQLSSLETARKYTYDFPGLSRFGFGKVNKLEWKRVYGRMEISISHGKLIGWERKLENGNWARVRIDFSPDRGAHYNIEVRVKSASGTYESHNLAVVFSCSKRPCTQLDYAKMLERLQ